MRRKDFKGNMAERKGGERDGRERDECIETNKIRFNYLLSVKYAAVAPPQVYQ